jgi:hypothetical protein
MFLGARGTAALLCTSALVLVSAAPGVAAEPVAQANATGLVLTVLSTPTDSGTYSVTNDGTKETATGSNKPAISLLDAQDFITAGTLAQDATTSVTNGKGNSAACAGLAGDGASLASVEDGGSCLTPANNATINAGTIDLSDLEILDSDLLAGLDDQTTALLKPVLGAILPALSDGLETALESLGDLGVTLDLGAIQSQCTAAVGTADGDSQLTDADLSVSLAGTDYTILALPVNPDPNTKVVTDTDKLVDAIVDGLQVQLKQALGGALGQLSPALQQLADALNANILTALSDQLAPLEDNLLDVTLNKQVRPTTDSIEVTALDLRLLPAASDFVDLLDIQIGRSACGPNGRAAAPPTDGPTVTPTGDPTPAVPTSVPAGEDASPRMSAADGSINGVLAAGALAALALVAVATGVAAYRRALR